MVVGTLLLGTDSFGEINSAMELIPRNNSLIWNLDIISLYLDDRNGERN
jgi:hypothetical protein